MSTIPKHSRNLLRVKQWDTKEEVGWTAGKFPSEECRRVQRVIYKMSCCHMNRHHHIWRKMAFSHDNSSSKNVNCRIAIWKLRLQNKHLCYFPLLSDVPLKVRHSSCTLKEYQKWGPPSPCINTFLFYRTNLMYLYMSVFFLLLCHTIPPTTGKFSSSLPLPKPRANFSLLQILSTCR